MVVTVAAFAIVPDISQWGIGASRSQTRSGTHAMEVGMVAAANTLYLQVLDLDGGGLVITDTALLAETIADMFDCSPTDVDPEYQPEDDE